MRMLRPTPASRAPCPLRDEGWSLGEAAEAAGASRRTAYKWLQRFATERTAGCSDRPSRVRRLRHATPKEWIDMVVRLRRFKQTARQIAKQLRMPRSTVSAVLARQGLGSQRSLEALRPLCRYAAPPREAAAPGHQEAGTLLRAGSSHSRQPRHPHPLRVVAIDDHSRLAYAEIFDDETGGSRVDFLHRAPASFAEQRIVIKSALADNGVGYRSHWFRAACDFLQSGICAPSLVVLRPTAKPSASFKRCCANGRRAASMTAARLGRSTCLAGSGSTIASDFMEAVITFYPSAMAVSF